MLVFGLHYQDESLAYPTMVIGIIWTVMLLMTLSTILTKSDRSIVPVPESHFTNIDRGWFFSVAKYKPIPWFRPKGNIILNLRSLSIRTHYCTVLCEVPQIMPCLISQTISCPDKLLDRTLISDLRFFWVSRLKSPNSEIRKILIIPAKPIPELPDSPPPSYSSISQPITNGAWKCFRCFITLMYIVRPGINTTHDTRW